MGNKSDVISNSLIPIKGISQAQKKALNTKCQIYDIHGLLAHGKTKAQREAIATKLGIDKKYVNLWIKQADLWRVMGMTADYAYLLVLAGVRSVKDLAKVDVNKTKTILNSISVTHPGFEYDPSALSSLIMNASVLEAPSLTENYIVKKFEKVSEGMPEDLKAALFKCIGMIGKEELVEEIASENNNVVYMAEATDSPKLSTAQTKDKKKRSVIETIADIALDNNQPIEPGTIVGTVPNNRVLPNDVKHMKRRIKYFSATKKDVEFDISEDPEPTYLFDDTSSNDEVVGKSESEIIREGLAFLQDIAVALPLPHIISGLVKIRNDAQGSVAEVNAKVANLLVELKGIVNPAVEASEGSAAITTYTDGEGRFSLVMPDKYSIQDCVEFVISDGGYKQRFVKQASEIIENTFIRNGGVDDEGRPLTAQALLQYYDELDGINKEILRKENEYKLVKKVEDLKSRKKELEDLPAMTSVESDEYETIKEDLPKYEKAVDDACLTQTAKDIKESVEGAKARRTICIKHIYGADPTTNNYEKTLTNLMSRTDLESRFDGDETDENCKNKCFVIVEEVFKNYKDTKPRALPSVRLMGEGKGATMLPTDCAPSRTYNYSMLQRLVEPSIYPPVGEVMENGRLQRKRMTEPVDVSKFKEDLMTDPDSIPKMSSLGMGYVLNMHQAWVPDGFALGTLLYSLILAPGEEQRLIVREHDESYNIMDTFEGSDETTESTSRNQTDDIQALYDYMLNQESEGSSSSKYKSSSWSIGGSASGGGGGFSLGLSGGYSKSSGSASSHSRQTNNHSEASQAAQSFNQQFSTAANLLAKAKRVSIRTASSSEKDSVATKIIANHNHSHAMTIQYWEVVRRYRLETSIDGVDLLLFVPLDLVRFLPDGKLTCDFDTFNKASLVARYGTVIRYYTTLKPALPYKYRSGLDLIQRFYSLPAWEPEKRMNGSLAIKLVFKTNLMPFDLIEAKIHLKNGKGIVAGTTRLLNHTPIPNEDFHTTEGVKEKIRTWRRVYRNHRLEVDFALPVGVLEEDIDHIEFRHSCAQVSYNLVMEKKFQAHFDNYGRFVDLGTIIKKYYDHKFDLEKDDKNTASDRGKMEYYEKQIPEAFLKPVTTLEEDDLMELGDIHFERVSGNASNLDLIMSSLDFSRSLIINVNSKVVHLRYTDFQKMEETFLHIASETLKYSQRIWRSMSSNELAMMLEKYNIDMNFNTYFDIDSNDTYVPLLNCVNIRRSMGFYGNCILLPFTYPEELAKKLGKTAGEIQDALYRYHTSCFRAPSTTISIPTDGMIGEAVLGATNVSEEIDLTRFWNWKDSPIDSMTLDSSYLNGGDYLGNKDTKDFSALNLQTANQVAPVTSADLISALVAKQTPQFENITGLDQVNSLLNNAMSTTAAGRDNVINQSTSLANKAMDYATERVKAESAERVAQIKKGNVPSTTDSQTKPSQSATPEGGGSDEVVVPTDPEQLQPVDPENPENPDGPDNPDDPDNQDKPDGDDSESARLKEIIQLAIDSIGKKSPSDFYTEVTGEKIKDSTIKSNAEDYCSSKGSDLDTVIKKILSKG